MSQIFRTLGSPEVAFVGRRYLLVLLLFAGALVVSGCQSFARGPESPPLSPTPGAVADEPRRPQLVRRQMSESPALFYEAVGELTEVDLSKIFRALRPLEAEQPWIKAVFGTTYNRKAVLALADPNQEFTLATGQKMPAAEVRQLFIQALDDQVVTALAKRLDDLDAHRQAFCKGRRPLIHNIGTTTILTFEKAPAPAAHAVGKLVTQERQRALRIPFDGHDLHPLCVNLDVLITGTVPLSQEAWGKGKEFYVSKPQDDRTFSGTADSGDIVLQQQYLDRLNTGDRVTVQLVINRASRES